MARTNTYLWVRKGDEDDYHQCESLDEVAGRLEDVKTPLERYGKAGVTTDGYEGNNYISLYWGDENADYVRDISTKDLGLLNRILIT